MRESEIRQQSRAILEAFTGAIGRAEITARIDLDADEWADLKQLLKEATDRRVERGFTPSEMATFILSLKQPVFEALSDELKDSPADLLKDVWLVSRVIDQLGLYTNEVYIAEREEIIQRQQTEMIELSTDRKSVVEGKSGTVRVDPRGRRIIKKTNKVRQQRSRKHKTSQI